MPAHQELTRREFLSRLLPSRLKGATAAEWSCEIASAGALLWAVWQSWEADKLFVHDVASEGVMKDNPEFDQYIRSLQMTRQIVADLDLRAEQLAQKWTGAYQRERVIIVPYTYACGDSGEYTCFGLKTKTETYWDEPSKWTSTGLEIQSINRWHATMDKLNRSLFTVHNSAPETFDFSNRGERAIYYKETKVDPTGRSIAGAILFSALGLAFANEEEIAQPIVDPKQGITRRSVLKVGAAALVAWQTRNIQKAFAAGNTDEVQTLKDFTQKVVEEMNHASPDQNFQNYFGLSVPQLRNQIVSIEQTSRQALQAFLDKDQPDLNESVARIHRDAISALVQFDQTFNWREGQYQIPAGITALIAYEQATAKITKFAASKKGETLQVQPVLNFLAAAGILGVSAVFIEALVKLTEPLAQKFSNR